MRDNMIKKICVVCGNAFLGSANSRYCSKSCKNSKIPTTDHVGETHFELKIESAYRQKSILYVICKCTCGNSCTVRYDSLLSGNTKSCGHLYDANLFKPSDLTGTVNEFGVVAIKKTGTKKWNSTEWECRCVCGKIFFVESARFYKTKSCGCSGYENRVKNMEKGRADYVVENTHVINLTHKKLLKNNTSGCTGVFYDKSRNRWVAQIVFKGRLYHLGRYERKKDAIAVRKEAENQLHSNFLKWFASAYPDRWEKIQRKNHTDLLN